MNLKQAQDKFRVLVGEAKALQEKDNRTSDETAAWEAKVAEAEALKSHIETLNRSAALDTWGAALDPEAKTLAAQVTTSSIGQAIEFEGGPSERRVLMAREPVYRKAWGRYMRGIADGADFKTLNEGLDDQGGYIAPVQMLDQLIEKRPAPTRVYERVTQFQASGKRLSLPRVNYSTDDIYSTGIRATLAGEAPASASVHRATDPIFGQTNIDIGTWMLSLPITLDLIEDATFELEAWVSRKISETFGQVMDNQILTGTGVGAFPEGILMSPGGTDQPAVSLSSTNDNIDADQIVGMPYDVPEQYIDNSVWVMNRSNTGKAIARLKDSANRYQWRAGEVFPGLASRAPDTLQGYPVVYSSFMPNIGDGAFPLVFGDLGGVYSAMRTAVSIQRLDQPYAETNQIVLLARVRWGATVAEAWRLRIGKSDAS